MQNKIIPIGIAVLLPMLMSAWAGDIIGKWSAQVPERQGTAQTVFNFTVDGTNLLGTVSNPQGESNVSEGKINGEDISFVVIRKLGGNQVRLLYKGKIAGDEIKFTRETEGSGEPVEFIAKREVQRIGNKPQRKYINVQ
jgi:hypothetical protein